MARVVQIADEANRRSMIENARWEGAIIMGPAVLAPLEDVTITNSSFGAPPEALFIEIPENRVVIGIIGLKNVSFDDCEFRNVAIAGTPESIATFHAGITEGAPQSAGEA